MYYIKTQCSGRIRGIVIRPAGDARGRSWSRFYDDDKKTCNRYLFLFFPRVNLRNTPASVGIRRRVGISRRRPRRMILTAATTRRTRSFDPDEIYISARQRGFDERRERGFGHFTGFRKIRITCNRREPVVSSFGV